MAVTVNTDSYGDEAGLEAYALARAVTITADSTVLLYKAMDYLNIQSWLYYRYSDSQALDFPRTYYDYNRGEESGVVPPDIVKAQYIAALLIDSGEDLTPVVGRATKMEKVDVIEVEYQDGASETSRYPELTKLLSRFLASSTKVSRA